jgi:hypothetical protein
MSLWLCLVFAAVLIPLGAFMCRVTWPMVCERAGPAHRTLGALVCASGVLLIAGGLAFLKMAAEGAVAGGP